MKTNKFEKPIEYILNYCALNRILDNFTINNAKDELLRLKEEIRNLQDERMAKVQ